MNFKERNKRVIATLLVLVSIYGAGLSSASANDLSILDVYVTGRDPDYTYYQTKEYDNADYSVDLNAPEDRDKVVLKTTLINVAGESRGECDIYEGTSNTGSNSGRSGFIYRLRCYRQYTFDGGATVTGTWHVQ